MQRIDAATMETPNLARITATTMETPDTATAVQGDWSCYNGDAKCCY
jgi:hypothetical protein